MTALSLESSPGRRKAAVALVALGPERAATILRTLSEPEVRALAREVARLGPVSPDEVRATLSELSEGLSTSSMLPAPGKRFAQDLLVRALGAERGGDAAAELDVPDPFEWLAATDPDRAASTLAGETPGALALALAHLPPKAAAALLTRLPVDVQGRVASRLAGLGAVHPDSVRQVEQGLRSRFSDVEAAPETQSLAGPSLLAGVLARAGRDASRDLLEALAAVSPELAEATRAALFTFDDVCALEPRAMQVLLRGVDNRELAVALSSSTEVVRQRVLANLSERAREGLLEEIDLLRDVRPADVTTARTAIVATARRLEEEGSLVLARPGDED